MLNPFMRRKIKWFHQTISVKNIALIVLTEHLINAYRTPNKQGCDLRWWINTFNKHSKQKISVYVWISLSVDVTNSCYPLS